MWVGEGEQGHGLCTEALDRRQSEPGCVATRSSVTSASHSSAQAEKGRTRAGQGGRGVHCPHVRSSSAPAIVPGVGSSAGAGIGPVGAARKRAGGAVSGLRR